MSSILSLLQHYIIKQHANSSYILDQMNDIVWFISTLRDLSGSRRLTNKEVMNILADAIARFRNHRLTLDMLLDLIRTLQTYRKNNLSAEIAARLTALSWSLSSPEELEMDEETVYDLVGKVLT